MKPLSERHADRAQRKADNAAESAQFGYGTNDGIGNAARAIAEAETAVSSLNPEQRDKLMERMAGSRSLNDGFASIAEDDSGALKMAGIGVINPLVTNAGDFTAAASEGVQATGELPTASYDPKNGNLNGAAVEAAGGGGGQGWGTASGDGYGALSLTELKAEADRRDPPVAYPAKVKDDQAGKDSIIAGLRADDAKKADAMKSGEGQGGDNS